MEHTISLRPAGDADLEFLCQVYAGTRTEELAQTDWSEAQKSAFLRSQFEAQHRYYAELYDRTRFDVIMLDGEPAGRLYVERRAREIRIVDIALLPPFRGRGTGTSLLQGLLREAQEAGLPLTIHVERFNPALRWYERLGFREVEDKGVYLFLECRPLPAAAHAR